MFGGKTISGVEQEMTTLLECARTSQRQKLPFPANPESCIFRLAIELMKEVENSKSVSFAGFLDDTESQQAVSVERLSGLYPCLRFICRKSMNTGLELKKGSTKTPTPPVESSSDNVPKTRRAQRSQTKVANSRNSKSFDSKPNAWANPLRSVLDPYSYMGFSCILCHEELSNGYFHCIGCEEQMVRSMIDWSTVLKIVQDAKFCLYVLTIMLCDVEQSLDFNICPSCHANKKYKVTMHMHPKDATKRPLSDSCHTGLWSNNVTVCKSNPNGKCSDCEQCTCCSCRCHTKFKFMYRFHDTQRDVDILKQVEEQLSASMGPSAFSERQKAADDLEQRLLQPEVKVK
jgi:hypothetical protein